MYNLSNEQSNILLQAINKIKQNALSLSPIVDEYKNFLNYKNLKFLQAYFEFRRYNWARVVELLDQIVKKDFSSNLFSIYIYSLLKVKNYKKAYKYCQIGLKKSPKSLTLKWLKARYFIEKKEFKKAQQILLKLLKLCNSNNKKRAIILADLGKIYSRKNNYTKALKYFFEALELLPNSPTINKRIGICYLLLADKILYNKDSLFREKKEEFLQNAIFFISKAISYSKDNSYNYLFFHLAKAYFLLNNFEMAEKNLLKYIEDKQNTTYLAAALTLYKLCLLLKNKKEGQDWDLNPD